MMEAEAPMRRSTSSSSSPEFEFWMGQNPCLPPPELLSADELFVDGVVLPLQLLSLQRSDSAAQPITTDPSQSLPPASIRSSVRLLETPSSVSRRWRDLFNLMADKKTEEDEDAVDKKRKKERKSGGSPVELNINIWPFSRSRSAGNATCSGCGRSRSVLAMGAGRKVCSAPCSRSNSRRESSKPPTAAVRLSHLGRNNNPVRQVRRAGQARNDLAGMSDPAAGVRVLNLNVNSCIGYGNQVSCRVEDSDGEVAAGLTEDESAASGGHGRLFGLRGLFSKKIF
ncbi:hypothetical protein AXF42_Ash015209 [Apostasia shenzhenica]|uniref:Uncharacterized protein n=1 Tax=Apostasia shenzhenica TaxID=1088818 RepID=A0A2I0AQK4_9ASPA|nr:hypothetical protein AXF42_Ash015209 [Apostasia shenzhenica]